MSPLPVPTAYDEGTPQCLLWGALSCSLGKQGFAFLSVSSVVDRDETFADSLPLFPEGEPHRPLNMQLLSVKTPVIQPSGCHQGLWARRGWAVYGVPDPRVCSPSCIQSSLPRGQEQEAAEG